MANVKETVKYIAAGAIAAVVAYTGLDLAITDSGEQTRRPTHAYRVNADDIKTTRKHDDIIIGFESNQYAELYLSDKTGKYSNAKDQRAESTKELANKEYNSLEDKSTKHNNNIIELRKAKNTLDDALNASDPTYKSK